MQWGIESIAAVGATQAGVSGLDAMKANVSEMSSPSAFADLMQRGINEVSTNISASETAMSDMAAGKPIELHEVMISLERARLSVQTFVQIRNKIVESYQDLVRMQL